METTAITSTFVITLLMMVGLFFFIRASVKDRTESVLLVSEQSEDSLLAQLKQYFADRAYRVIQVNPSENQVTFEGLVRPSLFLAIFLSLLAGLGILCLVLVLIMLFPGLNYALLGLVLLSPLAGLFYWRNAERPEQVALKVESAKAVDPAQSVIRVTAHRDELAELQRQLALKLAD